VAVATVFGVTRFGELDEHLFREGRHGRLYDKLGAHQMTVDGTRGTYFAVWAPNAAWVEVVGDFNGWEGHRHPLARREAVGVWEGFIPGLGLEERYKFRLASTLGGEVVDKADPFARAAEVAPLTASVTNELGYRWSDDAWMSSRGRAQRADQPISIYELHLGSWRVVPEQAGRSLSYGELAPLLIDHVQRGGYTHVEFMPVMEHPFYASWGYHVTGFFAPSSRYGGPDEFAALVDALHAADIGVLLDWVPAHFPADAFALARFDGTHLFEHADPRQGVHPDWKSLIFNYGRHEVRSFLTSAACFWLDRFHVDGLRFDAVASMLYLDYSREPGEWIPNRLGGRENLDAIEFLQSCNDEIHRSFPGAVTVAEESTSWPGVTSPVAEGGLGFDYKWDLGWMHDTLDYLAKDPVHRKWHHDRLTFRSLYATSERFVLPLSHDEVVHGKGSLLSRMPGDDWQRFANLRLLYGFQFAQSGKKLLFMGDEFAQSGEWAHDESIDWHVADQPQHRGVTALLTRLNHLYRESSALHRDDLADRGFAWIDADDRDQSVVCIERFDDQGAHLVIALNATPEPRDDYVVGMPKPGSWSLVLSSDAAEFGGSGHAVRDRVVTSPEPWHRRADRTVLTLPPLGFVIYAPSANTE
jgi:1,4-alpha-glucan branching enzyme